MVEKLLQRLYSNPSTQGFRMNCRIRRSVIYAVAKSSARPQVYRRPLPRKDGVGSVKPLQLYIELHGVSLRTLNNSLGRWRRCHLAQ